MQNLTSIYEITKGLSSYDHSSDHQVYITAENAQRTIYVGDLPKSITYLDLSEFFEQNVGPCNITIKR
jgi:RNA recognition motif-containing protein